MDSGFGFRILLYIEKSANGFDLLDFGFGFGFQEWIPDSDSLNGSYFSKQLINYVSNSRVSAHSFIGYRTGVR